MAQAGPTFAQFPPSPASNSARVLLIDDDPWVASAILFALEDQYSVVVAKDGLEGIDHLAGQHFHLVLLDLRIPRVEGTEVLAWIRSNLPTLPVIIITGYSSQSSAESVAALGVQGYLTKPFDLMALRRKVDAVVALGDSRGTCFDPRESVLSNIPHAAIRRVIFYIVTHPRERLSLNQLAEIACLSKHHLCRTFKAYTGESIKSFANRLKVWEAKRLLVESDATVEQIGMRIGFQNVAYFVALFKRYEGLPPGAFRRNQGCARP